MEMEFSLFIMIQTQKWSTFVERQGTFACSLKPYVTHYGLIFQTQFILDKA